MNKITITKNLTAGSILLHKQTGHIVQITNLVEKNNKVYADLRSIKDRNMSEIKAISLEDLTSEVEYGYFELYSADKLETLKSLYC